MKLFIYPVTAPADLQLEDPKAGGEGTKDGLKFGGQEEFFTVLGVHHPIGSPNLWDASEQS